MSSHSRSVMIATVLAFAIPFGASAQKTPPLPTPTGPGQSPGSVADSAFPVSHHDRVYAAEQFSNTISVTDPVDNALLGVIRLGDPQPGNLSPLYHGQLLVHGMGFSPDHSTLAVVSIGSNSVSFVATSNNVVKHVTYTGRSPHEAFFTPDGREVWVTVRGEDYVLVLDSGGRTLYNSFVVRQLDADDQVQLSRLAIAISPHVAGRVPTAPRDIDRARVRGALLAAHGVAHAPAAIAGWYRDIAGVFVLDPVDALEAPAVAAVGLEALVAPAPLTTAAGLRELVRALTA